MKSSKKSKTTKNYTKKVGGNNNKPKSILKKAVSFNPVTRANNGNVKKLKPSAGNQLNANQAPKAANTTNQAPPNANQKPKAENKPSKAANATIQAPVKAENKPQPTEPKSNDKKGEVIQPGMEAGMPGMMPGMMPQQGANEEENNNNNKMENDIKPLGSPSLYGAVVLGLFSFAAYLQFSAFRDKQV